MSAPLENTFLRTCELNNENILNIHQLSVGDVGCVVWDAALVLSKYLETKDFDQGRKLNGKRILELGAGTGIVGLVAATFGAKVTITDLPEFVPLINLNVTTNKELVGENAHAQSLTWGNDIIQGHYQYVFLADCIYYDQSLKPLVESLTAHCSPDTEIFCCYEKRITGNKPELEKEFFRLINERFMVEEIPMERHDEHFRSDDIHIIKFVLKEG